MKKYATRWIIALLSLALFGLLCVQLYWVNNAVDLKRELFRQSVNGAMSAVVSRLEKREVTSAVAQTVYAAATQPHDTAVPSAPPPPVPDPVPTPVEPATTRRPSGIQTANAPFVQEHSLAVSAGTGNTHPIIISHSRNPVNLYSFTSTPQNTRRNPQSTQTFRVIERPHNPIQLVHLDSMCNTMHLYLDSSILRQQQFLRQQRSMPRIAVSRNRERGNSRTQHSVTWRAEWGRDTASVQWQVSPQDFDNSMEVQFELPEIEQRIEHFQAMVSNMFSEPVVVELSEPFPPPSRVWACGHVHTDSDAAECRDLRTYDVQQQTDRTRSTAGTGQFAASAAAQASGTASGAGRPSTAVPVSSRSRQETAARATHSTETYATERRSDRDRLVSIQDMASRVVAELATGLRPIDQRVTPDLLDSLLRMELAQRGITLPYRYAVLSQKNSFALATPASYNSELKKSAFRTALYPNDIIAEPYFLSVYFPDQDEFVYESMWGVLGTSLLFLLLILGSFSFTLITLTRQKKLSDMKTDFINNMTHELKTPIATISLASEALRDPAVRGNDSRVMRFINAIFEENKRLGSQVERVLQAAVIDRGEVRISPSTVCVHDILKQALQTIALQVESRGGTVLCNFEARQDCIQADRVHLTNIIINLLDNANKYSPDSPRIVLSTATTNSGIIISVEDNGIGMSRDAQKRIFEQFYRVSTGNLHDVKGFGLGLSYVKAMVEAHGGTITVRSEPRHGSRFDLFFPFTGGEAAHV